MLSSAVLVRRHGSAMHPRLPSLALRHFSSSSKELSPYQKLQKLLQPFMAGFKAMYRENQEAWQLRRRVKEGIAAADGAKNLNRREMLLLPPVIGYRFPRQLLPWQFWRPEQKTQFFQEDVQDRAKTYPELAQLLLQIKHEDDALQEMLTLSRATTATTTTVSGAGGALRPTQVSELAPFFEGPAALHELSNKHIHVLAGGSAVFPSFAVLNKFIPQPYLQKRLERRMEELSVDDQQLLREGIDDLSLNELEFACQERGIVAQYGEIEALRDALREWLSMYDTDHFDPESNPQRLPSSLLLHAPVLSSFAKLEDDDELDTTV
ncbi:hypothetical protein BBJ29_004638 [Phytophthora kernoviae]|uniref:Letm1 RBD domain-containing protein n=1 Tax=Phytophthora kernoviae TaxID=325452 RepID=A0A3F2RLW2_9STRA|nr:hypothetical protein BBJ29_004638 [Phytophthora kernoviae]RLN58723.1 hypothetical protein BBP00_00006858 [Phytophthora kernoviae]